MYTTFKYLQGRWKNGGFTKIPSGLTIQSRLTNVSTLNKPLGNVETSGLLCKTSIVKCHVVAQLNVVLNIQENQAYFRRWETHAEAHQLTAIYGAILWQTVWRERSGGRRKMIIVRYGVLNAVKNIQLELGFGHQAQFLPLYVLIWTVFFCWITSECAKKTCK